MLIPRAQSGPEMFGNRLPYNGRLFGITTFEHMKVPLDATDQGLFVLAHLHVKEATASEP